MNTKFLILVAMMQMLTQLGMVFTIEYPQSYQQALRWAGSFNLNLMALAPVECMLVYNFYSSLVVSTMVPLGCVVALLLLRFWFKLKGNLSNSQRCVTAAFYIIFFVYPSVSAKIFTTFNCVTFDDTYDGSNSWMRVDLTVDCNAPGRGGWIAYACLMILVYPVGVPSMFAYLLLVRFHRELEEQQHKEQLATESKNAVYRADRLTKRMEESSTRINSRRSLKHRKSHEQAAGKTDSAEPPVLDKRNAARTLRRQASLDVAAAVATAMKASTATASS